MEKKTPRPMTPFDELVTSQELQMIKLLLPYTPSSNQQFIGVFIKFLELKDTISLFRNISNNSQTKAFNRSYPPSPVDMLQEMKPYMAPEQTEMMDTFLNMMNIMEMAQTFQGDSPDSGGLNPMDLMAGMMTPDQQNMFQMYNSMFSNEMDSMEKNSENKEPMNKESADREPMDREWMYQEPLNKESVDRDPLNEEYSGYSVKKGDDTDERLDEPSGNEEY